MKTFQQFLEQIEAAMKAAELAKEKTQNVTEMSALANMRHRRHVHGELSHMADYEIKHKENREKKFNPYA